MKRHIANTRQQLGDLHNLAKTTEASERSILARAEKRLNEVTAMLERQRPGIEAAPEAAQDRYTELVNERGQLQVVIARARQALDK